MPLGLFKFFSVVLMEFSEGFLFVFFSVNMGIRGCNGNGLMQNMEIPERRKPCTEIVCIECSNLAIFNPLSNYSFEKLNYSQITFDVAFVSELKKGRAI